MSLHDAHDRSAENRELALGNNTCGAPSAPPQAPSHKNPANVGGFLWLSSVWATLSEIVVSLTALFDVAWTKTKSGKRLVFCKPSVHLPLSKPPAMSACSLWVTNGVTTESISLSTAFALSIIKCMCVANVRTEWVRRCAFRISGWALSTVVPLSFSSPPECKSPWPSPGGGAAFPLSVAQCKHTVHVVGDVGQFRGILVGPDKCTSFLNQH